MVRRFTSVWGDGKPKIQIRPQIRPGAAPAATDDESGRDGGDSAARGLRALRVMLERGLITRREYDERRTALGSGRAAVAAADDDR
ncbi:MAG TPA: hypothetical protein VK943_02275 [Arenibaculum sp.]|nr:hypothetical protein [Arenibaculum sp.]